MKKIGLGLLNLSIAFVLLFSGMSGLGDVLLNAAEITSANTQNESEVTTSIGDEETSEVAEEIAPEESTAVIEESTAIVEEETETAVVKSAEEESNMVVQAAISEEEQELLNQLNPRMKSLEAEQKDFLTTEDTPESFIVFLKEDKELYNSATEVFSASAGKSVAPELSTLIVKKDEANLPDEQFINTLSNLSSVDSVVKNTVSQMTTYEDGAASDNMKSISESFSPVNSYGVPNDPEYVNQWEMQQMQMPKVWDLGKGKGVKIGVFDTGFQSAYRDSTGVEFDTNRILPLVRYAEDNTCYSHGEHGTMVLSIAGAVKSNNGIGIAGVASDATFQPYIAGYSCSSNGFGLNAANFVKVYEHALVNGVSIMNMSFGGSRYSEAENTVIQRATSRGLISVAARGNEGRTTPTVTNYPACYSGVVMVGALAQSNTLADFSTYGDCGNKNLVTAYGENVSVVVYRADGLYGGGANGTSFSSPITAGVLAVMKSANPSATSTELKNNLLSTATDLGSKGYDQKYGYGGINPLVATQNTKGEVREGDMVYYLNSDKTIKYANQISSGKKIAVYYYFTGTTIQNKQNRVRYKFTLKADGSEVILQLDEYNDNSKRVKVNHYFNNTKFANRDGNIQYSYLLKTDGSSIILQRNEYNKNVKRIGIVHYFANTTFANRSGKEQYKYILSADGTEKIVQRDEYNTSAKRIGAVHYFANTTFAKRSGKEQYKYILKADGSQIILQRDEYNTSAKRIQAVHYFANTTFANRAGKEQYKYILKADGSQIILQRDEYNLSGKRFRIVHYLANTTFANRANRHQYIYTLKADGSQILLQRDGYDTAGKRVSVAHYFANTAFANRANKIKFIYILNVNGIVLRKDEYNTAGKRIAYYLFASNTKFDANVDKKITKKVVV